MDLEERQRATLFGDGAEVGHRVGRNDAGLRQFADHQGTAQYLVPSGQAGNAGGRGDGRAGQLVAVIGDGPDMQSDADGQLEPGNRGQIGDPLLHVDGRLASLFASFEGTEQFVANNLDRAALVAVDGALHALQAALDGVHRLLVAESLEQGGAARDIGEHHDQFALRGTHRPPRIHNY